MTGVLHTEIDFQTIDGMAIKQIAVPERGTMLEQHAHKWGHSTLLAKGRVLLWSGTELLSHHKAPAIIYIPEGKVHSFQTVTDDVLLYCLHNLHGVNVITILEEEGIVDAAD